MRLPNGKIVHWQDCSVCIHRKVILMPAKKKGKEHSLEQCALTGINLPPPLNGLRYCELYQNAGCPCPRCQAPITRLENGQLIIQMDETLDRTNELC